MISKQRNSLFKYTFFVIILTNLTVNGYSQVQNPTHYITEYSSEQFSPSEYSAIDGYSKIKATFEFPHFGHPHIDITNAKYEPISLNQSESLKIGTKHDITYHINGERNNYYLDVIINPVIKTTDGSFKKLVDFDLQIGYFPSSKNKSLDFVYESVLDEGTFYKIPVRENGIYKITPQYFRDSLSIELNNLKSSNIQLYSSGAGQLNEAIAERKYDDLIENALFISDGSDDNFDHQDYILFYGQGPDKVEYKEDGSRDFKKNPYDQYNYYFLKIDGSNGKRVQKISSLEPKAYVRTSYDDIQRWEVDQNNLLGQFGNTSGTGQDWYGPIFKNTRELNISAEFDFENIDFNHPVTVKGIFAARSANSSVAHLKIGNQLIQANISGSNISNLESIYARLGQFEDEIFITNESPSISLLYPQTHTQSEGWVDYIELTSKKHLNFEAGDSYEIHDKNSTELPQAAFQIKTTANLTIWNISNPHQVVDQSYTKDGDQIRFDYEANGLKRFLIFDQNNSKTPLAGHQVENQNLHRIESADFIIIHPKEFAESAERLAKYRSQHTDLSIITVEVEKIYNEYSGGKCDPTAIRNFAKMIYDRDPFFQYLLLFGDGTYDYRGLDQNLPYTNFVPTYQTPQSLNPITGFPADDYYALLDDNEGGNLRGAVDLAVGRIPASSLDEANAVVDKIIHYETNTKTYGDWRNRLTFCADDEDSGRHFRDANTIAESIIESKSQFNVEKIYWDAYPQESTPGGPRFPSANEKLNNEIFRGNLVLNYLGHGGPKGWSQERVLTIDDINSWNNYNEMPLIVTATCSFTGYDDPAISTAGEEALFNQNGGAIALFSTVRAVYASDNARLTQSVFDTIFTKVDGEYMRIGEVIRRAKNTNRSDTIDINARKFALIGDPSMLLAIPTYDIVTTHINENPVQLGSQDTIKALQKVKIQGIITDPQGNLLTNFNGKIFPSVFDKKQELQTLGNDRDSGVRKFEVQRNIIFKGEATVKDGHFSFEFVVPKDIDYTYGLGKVSYYAISDDQDDATGSYSEFIIGGTEQNALVDDQGPEIQLYMNNESFVDGGETNNSPTLLAILTDETGINASGTSIGHDIVMRLDESSSTAVLNEYYAANIDDSSSGKVRFPLSDLESGEHSIYLRAFDVANNKGEATLSFIVVDDKDSALTHLTNYPNPFENTTHFSFNHTLPNGKAQMTIEIFNLSGQLVKTINQEIFLDNEPVTNIEWNGKNDFGNKLAKGIYVYNVKINSTELNISKNSSFEKLVILR